MRQRHRETRKIQEIKRFKKGLKKEKRKKKKEKTMGNSKLPFALSNPHKPHLL